MDFFDVVIIGAGPAGSVSAAYLNKHGKKILILEKSVFPRFVIGESLLPQCMDHLDEVGLLETVQEAKFQLKTGAIFCSDYKQRCFEFSNQFTPGWSWTWQVQREKFDKILIDEVQNRGVDIRFQCEVTDVVCNKDVRRITYKNSKGEQLTIDTKFIIDASGYGRVLPNLFDLNKPSEFIPRGAIFTHVRDSNRTENEANNIFIHKNKNNGWFWVIPLSDGKASIGIVGENTYIKKLSANSSKEFKTFIRSLNGLSSRLRDAELLFAPKNILGYSVGVKQMYGDGYVLCGNSTEFLDPVFSSGVTLATASGLLAAKLTLRQLIGEFVDWQKEYEDKMSEGIEVFRSYVNGWYSGDLQTIFFAHDIHPEYKKQITSVLAGYVWDKKNPFVSKHSTIIKSLAKFIRLKDAPKPVQQ